MTLPSASRRFRAKAAVELAHQHNYRGSTSAMLRAAYAFMGARLDPAYEVLEGWP